MPDKEVELEPLMQAAEALIEAHQELGYSPSQVIVICATAIAQILSINGHLELCKKSINEVTSIAIASLPTVQ